MNECPLLQSSPIHCTCTCVYSTNIQLASDHHSVHSARHRPIDIPGLKHRFESAAVSGIFHSHSFLIRYLSPEERVDPTNELEFGMSSGAIENTFQHLLKFLPHAEAIDCNHRLIVWSLLGIKEWDAYQIVKPRWDDMELNHLILTALALSINKIDATGAITVSAFNAALAHHCQYTLPAWSAKSGTPNFAAYACYVVCPSFSPQSCVIYVHHHNLTCVAL